MDLEEFLSEWHNDSPTVLVHTSGSTGKPKPMYVEKRRMEASARITCAFLGLKEGDTALLCMPLDYIAGKMMVVRALTCGLRLVSVEPSGHPLASLCSTYGHLQGENTHLSSSSFPLSFAAMVPLQVYNSLQVPEERERLMQIRHLIIGGGAIDDGLASALGGLPNQIWSTYGMTETLSHIALRRLNGPDASQWYTPFEGVAVSLSDDGCLVIDAPQICAQRLVTNDIAELSTDGRFRIIGRKDNTICSGGIKIQIEQVEERLKPYVSSPFLITKCKDEKFGEAIVLLTESSDCVVIENICRQVLPRFWQPRHYLHVEQLPLTETGKPARKEAERMAALATEV